MKRMRVCVVTGTRGEFGIWVPVLRAMNASKGLELKLVVTGMHLLKKFGETVKEIEAAGFGIVARVEMYEEDSKASRQDAYDTAARSLARGTQGLAAAYRKVGAELVMVLGDRLEMLAAASAALAERIPIGHVHGGETAPGIWDEQIRHAITKMAQVHFCATETARRRILRMGEDARNVHRVGAPALDAAKVQEKMFRRLLRESQLKIVEKQYPVLVLHPTSADAEVERQRALRVIRAIRKVCPNVLIRTIGPNNDLGHRGILAAYEQEKKHLMLEMSIEQKVFWGALILGGILVGNSSSGIIEAATFGCAVVNIGDRQAGRERNENVIDVGWNAREIEAGILKGMRDEKFLKTVSRRRNIYGDGSASGKIVRILEGIATAGGMTLEKRFADR